MTDTENVNVEMQVVGQDFWSERTLTYVCRNFCTLNKGEPLIYCMSIL